MTTMAITITGAILIVITNFITSPIRINSIITGIYPNCVDHSKMQIFERI